MDYYASIELLSHAKHSELCSLPLQRRWLWILGGGTIKTIIEQSSKYRYSEQKSFFTPGESVKQGVKKDDPQSCLEAYLEFKEIESRIPENSLMAFTDGSVREDAAGSGVAVYSGSEIILRMISQIMKVSIDYAELFAIYSLLKWLHIHYRCNNKQIHIFTDSLNTVRTLCNPTIPEKLFNLTEDIKNLAQILYPRFKLIIHWIPSHIERTSFGIRPIHGNVEADRLAKQAQNQAAVSETLNNIGIIRDRIFDYSASLTAAIDRLIVSKSVPCDGPSSDDFSLSDAIRDVSRDVP